MQSSFKSPLPVYSKVLTRCSSSKSVAISLRKNYNRRAQRGFIPKILHPSECAQKHLHVRTLHADAAAVNESHVAESTRAGLVGGPPELAAGQWSSHRETPAGWK